MKLLYFFIILYVKDIFSFLTSYLSINRIFYRVSRNSLDKEKTEYLRHILTKRADIFTTDKGVFVVHIHKRNAARNCFEVFTTGLNKKL